MRCFALKAASPDTALTMSWQSSNTPFTARLKMFGSCSENICAVWKGLMRPWGESMKTRMPFFPRIAYSAAEPVSPEVAPRMLSSLPSLASTYSNRFPSSCIARSLNASVGPLERPRMCSPGSSVFSGVMSSLRKVSFV